MYHEDPLTKNLSGFLETHFESPPFRWCYSTMERLIHPFVVSTRSLCSIGSCGGFLGDPGALDRGENDACPSYMGTSEAADVVFRAISGAVPTVAAAV